MTNEYNSAHGKLKSGFLGTTPLQPEPTKTPPTLDEMSLEQRVAQIEIHLGIRPKPLPPMATHTVCHFSGLRLPLKFFPSPLPVKPMSQFFNAYKSAHPDAKGKMAIPKTISQDTFDKFEPEFFPDDVPLGTKLVQSFLVAAAAKGLGETETQMFTNRGHHNQ